MLAVNHKEADRTPITFDAQKEVYEALYKHLQVDTKEELFDALNVDTWMMLPSGFEPTPNVASDEKQSIWGFRTMVTQYSAGGTYNEICYHPLAGRDEIDEIRKWQAPTINQIDFSHSSK